jgi:hypothetical protein
MIRFLWVSKGVFFSSLKSITLPQEQVTAPFCAREFLRAGDVGLAPMSDI